MEQITLQLNDLKHLLFVSAGRESGHSLTRCLWLRSSGGCTQAVSWGCGLNLGRDSLLPSSTQVVVGRHSSLIGAPHRDAPSASRGLPPGWAIQERERQHPRWKLQSFFFYNLVLEVASHNFCSVFSPRSKSVNPAHTKGEEIYTGVKTRGGIAGGCPTAYPALYLFRQRKSLKEYTRNF